MTRVMTKSTRKTISLLLTVIMLFSMCSVGLPAAAYEYDTLPLIRMATPSDETSTDEPQTDPEEQPTIDIPKYYYNDSADIASQPNDYINGIMIAHYFNIMGAYDGENNFKPNLPMKSSYFEYALKAIDGNEPEMTNFEGELITVQALVHRIWLAAGKGSYIYSAEVQQNYLSEYNLGISYNAENDLANAWTFCVKSGIIKQFLGREDFNKNLTVTRAMAAYALSNYYMWREGYDINNLALDIPGVAPIDEEEMNNTASATDAEGNKGVIKTIYNIGECLYDQIEHYIYLINADGNYKFLFVAKNQIDALQTQSTESSKNNMPHLAKVRKKYKPFIRLPDWGKILQGFYSKPSHRAIKKISSSGDIEICFGIYQDGVFIIDKVATVVEIYPLTTKGDMNENSNIGIDDCLMLQNMLAGIIGNSKRLEYIADFNSDGEANLLDAYMIWSSVNSAAANTTHTNVKKSANYTTFKFMADGKEILTPIEINANTHYLKLSKNIYEKENYSFNYWNLYRLDGNGNKLYYCKNSDGTGVQWLQNETDEYSKIKFANESFIYNVLTGKFNTLYFEASWTKDFNYKLLSNGTIEIARYNGKETYITIPSVIDEYTVTSIGDRVFSHCLSLTSITIPNSVTSIGNCVFEECYSLTSITISNSVTSIGNLAFRCCIGLTSITIPNSVTSIGNLAFSGCIGLTSITIPEGVTSIGNSAFSGCTALNVQLPERFNDLDYIIESNRFYNTPYLINRLNGYNVSYNENKSISIAGYKGNETEIIIPSSFDGCSYSVTSIGRAAFWDCTDLTNIIIPNSVTSIGDNAFYNCKSLTSITIPNSVTSIVGSAFYGCSSLTSITIPEGVTSIGGYAFSDCTSLTNITIPNSVTSIGWWAFDDTAWYNNQPDGDVYAGKVYYKYKGTMPSNHAVNIQKGTVGIAEIAFEDCTNLISITIPNSVTSVGDNAFRDCTNLTSITIPEGVTGIGYGVFRGCKSLTSITIPKGVTSIGWGAFEDCESLTSITIPNSVTSIGNDAFYNCKSLTSITIPNSVTSIGSCAFWDCTNLTNITFSENSKLQTIKNSTFSGCKRLASITIPDSVTSIEWWAFSDCTNLTGITIPNSVTSIGSGAFDDTAWYNNQPDGDVYAGKVYYKYKGTMPSNHTVNIQKGTVGIAEIAFEDCTNLISITIPNSVMIIGSAAFWDCANLTNITIPNSMTSIEDGAFYNCTSLTSITIPDSVTSIEQRAFEGCTSLASITIPNSVTSIGWDAFENCPNLTVSCYANSYAETYAIVNNKHYTLITDTP